MGDPFNRRSVRDCNYGWSARRWVEGSADLLHSARDERTEVGGTHFEWLKEKYVQAEKIEIGEKGK